MCRRRSSGTATEVVLNNEFGEYEMPQIAHLSGKNELRTRARVGMTAACHCFIARDPAVCGRTRWHHVAHCYAATIACPPSAAASLRTETRSRSAAELSGTETKFSSHARSPIDSCARAHGRPYKDYCTVYVHSRP